MRRKIIKNARIDKLQERNLFPAQNHKRDLYVGTQNFFNNTFWINKNH